MESDSSLENEETAQQQSRRDWPNVPPTQNSDVSDDENFSRGAKSIESPPESPWCGANLDSPPASPAPRRSPGSDRRSERPQTPDSGPESPYDSSSRNSRNSAQSSPGSGGQSPKNSRSRKSRSSSSERSRSPDSEGKKTPEANILPRSPRSETGPQSPDSEKRSLSAPQSPSDKEGPRSPSDNERSRSRRNESSDSDATPVRKSFNSDSEDDRSSEDYGRRRKSKRSPSVSSNDSRRQGNKPHEDKDLDLSDVSDCDSLGPVSDEENKNKNEDKDAKEDGEKGDLAMIDDTEQLDFEAEETENSKVENGDLAKEQPPSKNSQSAEKQLDSKEEEELEEGELSDEGEARPEETEPRPVCRFFSRGQCTWGSSCSYQHVGAGGVAPTTNQTQKTTPTAQTSSSSTQSTSQSSTPQHSTPIAQHGAPLHQHSAMHHTHPHRFVPRPHAPHFFRRPLRPMFPRFVHPGVTDKGNYTMFEMVRPLVPMNAGGPMLHAGPHGPPHLPPHHHMYPPHMDPYMRPPHIERPPPPMQIPPPYHQQQPVVQRKEQDQGSESAWERGLRQAKEMIRKSSKRKETDVDFNEKKMTMSSAGTEGVDKENEFYSQSPHAAPAAGTTSPFEEQHYPSSRYNKVDDRRLSREGYRERIYDYAGGGGGWGGYDDEGSPPPPIHHRPSHHRYPRHHHQGGGRERIDYEYYDERDERERDRERDRDRRRDGKDRDRRKSRTYRDRMSPRDQQVSHQDKQSLPPYHLSPSEMAVKRRYDRSRGSKSKRGGADDAWADPWMRSKSPSRKGGRTVTRKMSSFSSKSSFSSSSSSRSSSFSSYSRSDSRSSASGSSRSRSRSASAQRRNKKRKVSPVRRNKSPFSRVGDKRSSDVERSLHMNPPAPSPTSANNVYSRPPRKDRKELRMLAAAMRKHKRSSSKSSSSGSDSSNSSDDSSSSLSDSHSSSSSRSPSPAPPTSTSHKSSRKKVVVDEKLAQTMKLKAMDALKLSGQKQQIKLNLKGKDSLSERLSQMPVSSSRKRPAESLPFDDSSPPNVKVSKKSGTTRKEELLKQLKAVEDAIARKRSKI